MSCIASARYRSIFVFFSDGHSFSLCTHAFTFGMHIFDDSMEFISQRRFSLSLACRFFIRMACNNWPKSTSLVLSSRGICCLFFQFFHHWHFGRLSSKTSYVYTAEFLEMTSWFLGLIKFWNKAVFLILVIFSNFFWENNYEFFFRKFCQILAKYFGE